MDVLHLLPCYSLPLSVSTPRNAVFGRLRVGFSSAPTVRFPRRLFLQLAGFGSVLSLPDLNTLAAPFPEMMEPEVIRTLNFPSGVRVQEILEGEGPEAQEGDLVEVNYVCRRANGYFVHSTVDQFSGESSPIKLPLDESQVIKGLKEVLVGMRVGGKRRALIPPSVGYVNEMLKPIPDEFGPRRSLLSHASEPLVFEVQCCRCLSGGIYYGEKIGLCLFFRLFFTKLQLRLWSLFYICKSNTEPESFNCKKHLQMLIRGEYLDIIKIWSSNVENAVVNI